MFLPFTFYALLLHMVLKYMHFGKWPFASTHTHTYTCPPHDCAYISTRPPHDSPYTYLHTHHMTLHTYTCTTLHYIKLHTCTPVTLSITTLHAHNCTLVWLPHCTPTPVLLHDSTTRAKKQKPWPNLLVCRLQGGKLVSHCGIWGF